MDDSHRTAVVRMSGRSLSGSELNEKLRELSKSPTAIELVDCRSLDFIAAGLDGECRLSVDGELGDFCFCGVANVEVEVRGRVGHGFAEGMESGVILVNGDAGDACAAFNRGGSVAVRGEVGRRVAVGMTDGDVAIHGSVGSQAGMEMRGGTLLILGSSGSQLGWGMQGGTIYLQGEAESLAPQLEESRFKDADRLKVGLILLKAGFQIDVPVLRVLRVRS